MRIKQIVICTILLVAVTLTGCSKQKVNQSEDYSLDEITSVKVVSDSWNVNLLPSSDTNIHVTLEGKDKTKPTVSVSSGVLNILQEDKTKGIQDQIALGKEGQLNIYLPDKKGIPVVAQNKDGNMDVSGISVADFSIENKSGSINFNGVNVEKLKVNSVSGDISISKSTFKQSDITTTSGYVKFNQSVGDIISKTNSGEVKLSEIDSDTNINIQTVSGDSHIIYKTVPDNLSLNVTSGSNDISVKLKNINYKTETRNCRDGYIGDGKYELKLMSERGTVVVE